MSIERERERLGSLRARDLSTTRLGEGRKEVLAFALTSNSTGKSNCPGCPMQGCVCLCVGRDSPAQRRPHTSVLYGI